MKLPPAVFAGLPERAPRGRAFAVTRLSHVAGPGIRIVNGTLRHDTLDTAITEAERVDLRLNPQIILVEAA